MNKLLEDLSSGYWWLSVVLIGLVINLASAFIKDPLDRQMARLVTGWGHRSDRKERELLGNALSIALNPDVLPYWIAHEMRVYLIAVFVTGIAILAAVLTGALLGPNGQQLAPITEKVLRAAMFGATAIAALVAFRLFARGIDLTIVVRTSMRLRECANWKPPAGCSLGNGCNCARLRFRPRNLGG